MCKNLLWAETGSCCQFCIVLSWTTVFLGHLINTWHLIKDLQSQLSLRSLSHLDNFTIWSREWQNDNFSLISLLECEPRLFVKGAGSDYIWKEQVIVLLFHLCGFCWNYKNHFFCDLFSVPLGRIPSPSRPQGSSVAPCVSWNWVACCLIGDKFLLPQLRV